jgi:hypothetical protein
MRAVIFLIFLFIGKDVFCQSDTSIHFFKEIGWTVKIPSDFTTLDSATNAQLASSGKEEIEGAIHQKVNTSHLKNLITVSKNKFEYFGASLNTATSITQENWETVDQSVKEVFYKTYVAKLASAKIDSASSKQVVDGISFNKFTINIQVNPQVTLHSALLSTYYKSLFFSITYLYIYEGTGQEINTILDESKFER